MHYTVHHKGLCVSKLALAEVIVKHMCDQFECDDRGNLRSIGPKNLNIMA
jgi:hypothetical protein